MDLTKYENLLNDLSAIEAEVAILRDKLQNYDSQTSEIESISQKMKQENTLLKGKVTELEIGIENIKKTPDTFNTLNSEEREALKIKLQELISRIDFHISAEKQS